MARIRVVVRATGKTGTVEDWDFNPQKFSPVEQPKQEGGFDIRDILGVLGGVGGFALGGPVGGLAGGAGGAVLTDLLKGKAPDPGAALTQGALSAIPVGRVLGLGKGALGKFLNETGKAMRKSVVNPKVAPSPFGATEEAKIAEGLAKEGFSGSAGRQYLKLPGKFKELGEEIDNSLAKKNPTLKVAEVVNTLNKAVDKNINFDPSIAGYVSAKDKFINQLVSQANKGKTGLNIDTKSFFTFKKSLNSQLSRTFDKLERGADLTPQEEVGLSIWEATDDLITKAAPHVKELTRRQSLLFKAAPGLKAKSQKPASIPFIGKLPGLARGEQEITDLLGRLSQGSGGLLGTGGATAGAAGRSLLARPTRGEALAQTIAQGGLASMGGEQASATSTISPQLEQLVTQGQGQQASIFPAEVAAMMILQNPKQSAAIQAAYKLANQGAGGQNLNANQKQGMSKLAGAENLLNSFERQLSEVGLSSSPFARITGAGRELKANLIAGSDPKVKVFNETRQGVASLLAKSLGEVGNLNEGDVRRAIGLIPQVSDTPEEAALKLAEIRNIITGARQGILSTSVGNQETNSLDELMFALGGM